MIYWQHMKTNKILFWIPTIIIFLFEGVMPALTGHSQMSINGITGLGYPVYFVTILTVFKVLGAVALVYPALPRRVKEWAYAGFGIDFICAFVSIWVVMGFSGMVLIPLVAMALLVMSYVYWNKIS